MRRRLLLNLILVFILGALVLVAVFEPGKKPVPEPLRIATLGANDVTRITIERQGQDTLTFTKDKNRWSLTAPQALRANDVKVRSVLRFLETRADQKLDEKDLELKRFGLAEPKIQLQFNETRFALGDTNPVSGKRYILAQDQIYLATDSVYQILLDDPVAFADLNLLDRTREPVSIKLPGLSLTRAGAKWSAEPADPKTTGDAIATLVEAWKSAQAVSVKRLQAGGTGEPVSIAYDGGETIQFELREKSPELILARKDLGLEYHLFGDNAGRLLKLKQAEPTPTAAPSTTPAPSATPTPTQ